MKAVIEFGTIEDYVAMYGAKPPYPARIWVSKENDVVTGMFGYYQTKDMLVAFCRVADGVTSAKKIFTTAVRGMRVLTETRLPLFAIADSDMATSQNFLERLGFEHIAQSANGEIYKWPLH